MNKHPIVQELQQQSANFQNPDHADYRQNETHVHHTVRQHTIHALDISLAKSAENRGEGQQTELTGSQVEQLQQDIDTFRGALTNTTELLQRGLRNPQSFRDMLRKEAPTVDMTAPRPPQDTAAAPTLAEITTYLEVQHKKALYDKEPNEFELLALEATKALVGVWREQRKSDPQVGLSQGMRSPLGSSEKTDLVRAQHSAYRIGEEVLQHVAELGDAPSSSQPDQRESARRTPENRLTPELHRQLAKAAKGNTIIHTSLPSDSGARSLRGPFVDGFNDIGDAASIPSNWSLQDQVVDENSILSGIHVRHEPGSPDVSLGMPEIICFAPQTKREEVEQPRGFMSRKSPPKYREVDVTEYSAVTGRVEKVVNFMYSYDEKRIHDPALQEELAHRDPVTGRGGNLLQLMVPLPKSIADAFQRELTEDPNKVRGFIEELVKERGGVSAAEWDGSAHSTGAGVRPPSFVKDAQRSPRAERLAALPRIIVPIPAASDKYVPFGRKVFRIVA